MGKGHARRNEGPTKIVKAGSLGLGYLTASQTEVLVGREIQGQVCNRGSSLLGREGYLQRNQKKRERCVDLYPAQSLLLVMGSLPPFLGKMEESTWP